MQHARAAVTAPPQPGVYFLLGRDRQLLYVGKAKNLSHRLRDHARSERWREIVEVCYEVLDSERTALFREADILAALRPPWNKAHVDGYFSYVTVTAGGLKLGPDGDYGCFPHLGRGALSLSGRACIDGFDALNRIVKLTRPDQRLVHDFLTGRSSRLLRQPHDIEQPHIAHGLLRDRLTAAGFYEAGPRSMRAIRLRHAGRGQTSRAQFVAWISEEVERATAINNPWSHLKMGSGTF